MKRSGPTGWMLRQMARPAHYLVLKAVNNWKVVVGLYAATILLGATAFTLLEEGRSFGDSLWWAFVTGLTIGYGDVYPETPGGRVTGILLAHTVILVIVPMIIAHMTLRLIVDHDRFTHHEQEEIKAELDELRDNLRRLMDRLGVGYVPSASGHPGVPEQVPDGRRRPDVPAGPLREPAVRGRGRGVTSGGG